MVFSSYLFLFYFLPVALLLYYAAPRRAQHLVLTVAQLSSSTAGRTRCSRPAAVVDGDRLRRRPGHRSASGLAGTADGERWPTPAARASR